MAAFLEVVDLRKQYGTVKALDGVSFSVREGELFGLLGPNGAGKTTLLSILSCLMEPTSGEVRLQGRRVHRGDRRLRQLIGVVPQELALYGDLTARENLHFFGELYRLTGAALRERVNAVLSAVALEDKANERVHTFSGGMKRRLNLGAALVHGPRLLLLDEPTVGVDPQSRNHIFEEVRRLNAAGVTILYTSHYMEEVQTLCPRVGIMDHGRLAACGEVPDLLRQLNGLIRIRVPRRTPGLRDRLKDLPDCFLNDPDGWRHERAAAGPGVGAAPDNRTLELNCRDVKATLVRLVAVLNELKVELISLETEEPNLERVFLHLTGRELRD
jgi:ABC-2 type transport system ATP-binding protein